MKHIRIFSLFAVLLALTACGGTDPDVPEETIEVTDYVFSKPSFVFGFSGQKRYSYCPSVIANADGTSHVYFCGNPNQGTMVDNIYHIVENANGTHTTAVSVLQPSLSWDSHHTCDPSVIEGSFKMDGTAYKYALFFLSNPKEYYYNEIGVAFSNDLEAASCFPGQGREGPPGLYHRRCFRYEARLPADGPFRHVQSGIGHST